MGAERKLAHAVSGQQCFEAHDALADMRAVAGILGRCQLPSLVDMVAYIPQIASWRSP